MILETTFLIDLERELRRGGDGPAQAFLATHSDASLFVTFTITGELAAGFSSEQRPRWDEFVQPFEVLECTDEVSWTYGRIYRFLKMNGLLIGANDLWIGATAVAHGKQLVTRNVSEFRRIPELRVVDYTAN